MFSGLVAGFFRLKGFRGFPVYADKLVIQAAVEHAKACFPQESCGLVVEGQYVPCENVSPEPTTNFQIDPRVYARLFITNRIEAIIHSHPDGKDYPSKLDMARQIESKLPWGVLPLDKPIFWFGDACPTPALKHRPFRHGVTDCYSAIRDYYRINLGVVLKEYPRDFEWWINKQNLYLDNFVSAGFSEIDFGSVEANDVLLFKILSPVPNHAGVVINSGTMYHHLAGRLSCDEPIPRWQRFLVKALRYTKR